MTKAKIYQPDKNAMQSGKASMKQWLLEFTPQKPYFVDNLMGWVGMEDMPQEVRLRFSSQEAAITYAKHNDIEYETTTANTRKHIIKAYADNFKFNKRNG
jgi:hypothetical protein